MNGRMHLSQTRTALAPKLSFILVLYNRENDGQTFEAFKK